VLHQLFEHSTESGTPAGTTATTREPALGVACSCVRESVTRVSAANPDAAKSRRAITVRTRNRGSDRMGFYEGVPRSDMFAPGP